MSRPHPLNRAAGKAYDAARLLSSLSLVAERVGEKPSLRALEYVLLLVGEVLDDAQAEVARQLHDLRNDPAPDDPAGTSAPD